jgi:excisionase family DNA binding protein
MDEETYTVSEAAKILRLGQHRIRQMLREGTLEGFRDETTDRWFADKRAVHLLKEERDAKAPVRSSPEAPTAGFSGHDPYRMMRMCGLDVEPV